MSSTPPPNPPPALQTVLTWVRAFNAESYEHHVLPASICVPRMTRGQHLAFLSGSVDGGPGKPVFTDFKVCTRFLHTTFLSVD